MTGHQTRDAALSSLKRHGRELTVLALLIPAASCVPGAQSAESIGSVAVVAPSAPAAVPAAQSPASPPAEPSPVRPIAVAAPFDFTPNSDLDRVRALDCLAEAVYYEARSESEGGQRAVAQVVLNRVRHPAYPHSVCGVVHQGPMKAGGGCQFTYTCDGSLARRPVEPGWSRARRIAAEALAGEVYAPVGRATHYHSFSVAPAWAAGLARVAVIGSHIFYRSAGGPPALGQDYAGREPSPRVPRVDPAPAAGPSLAPAAPRLAYAPAFDLPEPPADRLPRSGVRPEYANSGAWLSEPR